MNRVLSARCTPCLTAVAPKTFKVLIPYDGSESAETALDDLRRAGLPQELDALVAVTNVWLPLSPYEITRAVSARRMMVLTAGVVFLRASTKGLRRAAGFITRG